MKRVLKWMAIVLPVLVVASVLILPWLARVGSPMGKGSYKHARKWRTQLLACQSLEDVKEHFNCFEIVEEGGGASERVAVTDEVDGRAQCLIESFPDGRWIACAHACSHGEAGGGTIVSRDSEGRVHVFFGHVCGHVWAMGETLEEFHASLRGYNGVEEKALSGLE